MNIGAEIADVQSRIRSEIEKYVAVARNELAVAQSHERSLRQNLNSLSNRVGDLNEAEINVRVLEREAEANRNLYQAFLVRYKETSIQEEVQQADARVISYAEVAVGIGHRATAPCKCASVWDRDRKIATKRHGEPFAGGLVCRTRRIYPGDPDLLYVCKS